jgi:hypothetical protein
MNKHTVSSPFVDCAGKLRPADVIPQAEIDIGKYSGSCIDRAFL